MTRRRLSARERRERDRARSRSIVLGNSLILAMLTGFLLVVLLVAGWFVWTIYGLVGMRTFFRPAEATIISSKVVCHSGSSDGGDSTRWEARLRYTYTVNGRSYEGYRYNPSFGGGFSTEAGAEAVVNALKPGTVVTIRYDPLMPSQSAVSSDLYYDGVDIRRVPGGVEVAGGGQFGALAAVAALFLLGAGIFLYQRRKTRKKRKTPDPRPLTERLREWLSTPSGGKLEAPGWFLLVFPLVFCGGGLCIMATAFTPREPSEIAMGTPGQLFFGLVIFLIGLGPLGVFITNKASSGR